MAIDVETKDPDINTLGPGCRRPGCHVVGVGFAIEDGPKHYLPMRHAGGDNLDVNSVLTYLREQAKVFRGDLVGAYLNYDMDWLLTEGVDFQPRFWRDVQNAAPLIYEHHDYYSLDAIAHRLGIPGKDETLLRQAAQEYGVDPKGGMWQLPARFVGPYAEQDNLLPLQILRRQDREIAEQDLGRVWDLESRVLPVLVRMRRRGVRIDLERLRKIEDWSLNAEAAALKEVEHLTGCHIGVGDVWKPDLFAAPLKQIGINLGKTAAGKDSVDKDILKGIDHPVARLLSRARKVNKLRTTFAASVRKYMVNGRIHCTFNQLRVTDDMTGSNKGARYGRLSCVDPNLQQQPTRDDEFKEWRCVYLPDEGKEWCSADYSQQEPRWLVQLAETLRLPGAKEAAQLYRDDPDADNHTMMTKLVHGDATVDQWIANEPKVFKGKRDECKIVFLARCYGQGGASLCGDLQLPIRYAIFYRERGRRADYFADRAEAFAALQREEGGMAAGRVQAVAGTEGQAIIDNFDRRLPFVGGCAKAVEEKAKERGWIKTLSGRRCRFPQRDDGSYDWAHKGLNRYIQGSSADQTKETMVAMDAEGIELQLQVHDEVDWSIGSREEALKGAEIMRTTVRLSVPFKVDIEVGPSWGEIKGIAA